MACTTLAVIDIGTNSVKLTVAQKEGRGALNVLDDTTTITRLGKDVDASGQLDMEAAARTLEVITEYTGRAIEKGATRIATVGTSALRDVMQNGNSAFTDAVEKILGNRGSFEIISGMREAKLIFNGARRDPDLHLPVRNPSAILPTIIATVDIGGGSTEVILGHGEAVVFQESLQMGAVRLTERALLSDPITPDEVADANRIADDALLAVPAPATEDHAPQVILVASGGTIVNLATISTGKTAAEVPLETIHGTTLSRSRIETITDWLAAKTLEQRCEVPGLEPDRADVIVGGAIIQARTMRRLGTDTVYVSVRGLRFGLLYEMFDNEMDW